MGRALARSICAFFDGTAHAHHEDDEHLVFPPLLAGDDADLVAKVRRLQQDDHGWIEEDWRELRAALAAVAEQHAGQDPAALRRMCDVFCKLGHIALEESLVYPEAKRRLLDHAQAEQRRIAASA